jgi:hypothetical protein
LQGRVSREGGVEKYLRLLSSVSPVAALNQGINGFQPNTTESL